MTDPSLVGTWKLVHTASHAPDGTTLPPPYGPIPMGVLTITTQGRMMAVLCDGRGGSAPDWVSYGGAYRFDGTTLVTQVEFSSAARIAIGGEQVRGVRFDGDRLVLTPPPGMLGGVVQHRTLSWERLSDATA